MAPACYNCGGTDVDKDPARGDTVCTGCGSVLEDTIIVSEVQFADNSGGGSSVIGQFVSSEGGGAPTLGGSGFHTSVGRESRQVTLQKGKRAIQELAGHLKLNQNCVDIAFNFFKMAVTRRLTRGRKSAHVIAACLYLVCRTEGTPHMLLDFSDVLQINVYNLGKTYLQLSRLLCINVPAIDPCLLIPRFSNKLKFGDKEHDVSMTAMRLLGRMKRDWMAIGRRPSGLCGAALLVAARIHNFCRTKQDIIKVVKVCEQTIRKRLIELEDTASSNLTIDQFQTIDLEEEADPPAFTQRRKEAKLKQLDEQLNIEGVENEITDVSKEIDSAIESRAAKNHKAKEAKLLGLSDLAGESSIDDPRVSEFLEEEILSTVEPSSEMPPPPPPSLGPRPTMESLGIGLQHSPIVPEPTTEDANDTGELDLNGLDDDELDNFILTDSEVEKREKVWMELNGEFLKEYEEKKRKREEEAAAKPPKIKRRKKTHINASTAGEAMEMVIQEKKLSSKINYDVLKMLVKPGGVSQKQTNPDSPAPSTSALDSSTPSTPAPSTSAVGVSAPIVEEKSTQSQPGRRQKKGKEKAGKSFSAPSLGAVKSEVKTPSTVVESGPVTQTESHIEDEELEEEDDDEPMSAAQLLGHGDEYYDGGYDEEY